MIFRYKYSHITASYQIRNRAYCYTTKKYTVKTGDTLNKIANKYGVTVASIRKANKLTKDDIKVGQVTDFDLNCLGNVFLVGKSTNSRMSDKNPKDKASIYGGNVNLAPNRQIIYDITNLQGWGRSQIENHLNFIEAIFNYKDKILQNSN